MKVIFSLCVLALAINIDLGASMFHQRTIQEDWIEENIPPFDEWMMTWNAPRPTSGKYHFYVSVKTDEWSPWLLYSTWGSDGQVSYLSKSHEAPVRVYQDALEVLDAKKATAFQVRVVPEGDAALDQIHALHVYTNADRTQEPKQTPAYSELVDLPVHGLSQMLLNHVRHMDLCSPTSTTAVVRYLLNSDRLDPIYFAAKSWDGGFDIFGNWVFNLAQAWAELGPKWNCWVERLQGFDDIYQRLHQGTPVIVSVRGPLPRSARPYAKGHLMAVIGYDPMEQKVICMDPAFPCNQLTRAEYDLSDFLQAWDRRGRVAYIFSRE